MPGARRPYLGVALTRAGLKSSRNPYVEKRLSPYFSRMAISAGIAISGANGTDPPAAVGAIVPSSRISPAAAPRAVYVQKSRGRPLITRVVPNAPPPAVRPQAFAP